MKQTYEVAEGIKWINGAPVPDDRIVQLGKEQAVFELAYGRVKELEGVSAARKPKLRRTKNKPAAAE